MGPTSRNSRFAAAILFLHRGVLNLGLGEFLYLTENGEVGGFFEP